MPIPVCNVDGTENKNGPIMEEIKVILGFGDHSEQSQLAVADLGQQTVIVGYPWLLHHNLEVNWVKQRVKMT